MAKGYWVARVDVADAERYKDYVAANAAAFAKIRCTLPGARRPLREPEGGARQRNVIIEFPSYRAALDCWNSPEYRRAWAIRQPVSSADVVIVEGYEGPQPA